MMLVFFVIVFNNDKSDESDARLAMLWKTAPANYEQATRATFATGARRAIGSVRLYIHT